MRGPTRGRSETYRRIRKLRENEEVETWEEEDSTGQRFAVLYPKEMAQDNRQPSLAPGPAPADGTESPSIIIIEKTRTPRTTYATPSEALPAPPEPVPPHTSHSILPLSPVVMPGRVWGSGSMILTAVSLLVFGAFAAYFFSEPDPAQESVQALKVRFFDAVPALAKPGDLVTLSWGVTGATTVKIVPGGEGLQPIGEAEVSPMETTNYTLIAQNESDRIEKVLTVEVSPRQSSATVAPSDAVERTRPAFRVRPMKAAQANNRANAKRPATPYIAASEPRSPLVPNPVTLVAPAAVAAPKGLNEPWIDLRVEVLHTSIINGQTVKTRNSVIGRDDISAFVRYANLPPTRNQSVTLSWASDGNPIREERKTISDSIGAIGFKFPVTESLGAGRHYTVTMAASDGTRAVIEFVIAPE